MELIAHVLVTEIEDGVDDTVDKETFETVEVA